MTTIVRCKARKTEKKCLMSDKCLWDNGCLEKELPNAEPKKVVVKCKSRKTEKTCIASDACAWTDNRCDFVINMPPIVTSRVLKNLVQKDITQNVQLDDAAKKDAIEKIGKIVAERATPGFDRLSFYQDVRKYFASPRFLKGPCKLSNGVELIKRIGSASKNGIAYLAKIKTKSIVPRYVAIKIMAASDDNNSELFYYKKLAAYVQKLKTPHFPLVYAVSVCSKALINKILPEAKKVKGGSHKFSIVFNELANGDLKAWLNQPRTEEAHISCICQIVMSLVTMEKLKVAHNDMHWGNVLFHDIPSHKGRYLYYVIVKDGVERKIYIKSTGQLWVMWDFGLMLPWPKPTEDLAKISMYPGWTKYAYKIDVPPVIVGICNALRSNPFGAAFDVIANICEKTGFGASFMTTTAPPTDLIINKYPYKL